MSDGATRGDDPRSGLRTPAPPPASCSRCCWFFTADETLRRAFIRSLEVIGEAAKKVPDDFRAAHPTVEWRAMAGMRDRLIHNDFGVDLELVWDVVRTRVPAMRDQIAGILES